MNIKYNLIKALDNVSYMKGMVYVANLEHELGCEAKYLDDYLAVGVLADLIKDNKVTLYFKVGKEDKDMKYLLELLKGDK